MEFLHVPLEIEVKKSCSRTVTLPYLTGASTPRQKTSGEKGEKQGQ